MTDPYKVLGVSPQATDEQVKAAYRQLARKYHPDNYANNPLADLAAEKMKEINAAYDEIQARRKGYSSADGQTGGGPGGYSAGYGGQAGGQFADIRRLIAQRRIAEADELLSGVPEGRRDAEWHFLKGHVLFNRGWTEDAYQHFQRAAAMDPGNAEYQQTLGQMNFRRQTGYPGGYARTTYSSGGCSICDVCAALWCADCCCGNSIRCCF